MATSIAKIRRLADDLEALTREESLRDVDPAKQVWSPAGLRELAGMRDELAAERSETEQAGTPEVRSVVVTVSELIDHDLEGLLDIFNERGWPEALISDIQYAPTSLYEDREAIEFVVSANVEACDDETQPGVGV
jgi:hypothetical protein